MSGPEMHPPQFMLQDKTAEIILTEKKLAQAVTQAEKDEHKDSLRELKKEQHGVEGERFVFNTLRTVLPDDWIVFHSFVMYDFNLNGDKIDYRHSNSYNRELDFVIINPRAGILVLEVKHWHKDYAEYVEREGSLAPKKHRQPIEQAASAARTLHKWLTEKHKLSVPRVTDAAWMTADSTDTQKGNPKYLCEHTQDRSTILKWLNAQFSSSCSPDSWDMGKVVELLAHAERYRISLTDYDRIIDEATAKINNLLPMLRTSRTGISVEGCAGSGKTVMAVREASRLSKEGKRVLYVCFTANLPAWLKCVYPKELQNVDVYTFHGFCSKVKGSPCTDQTFAADFTTLRRMIQQNPRFQYDDIFVDEAQDFDKKWWQVLTDALCNNRKENPDAKFYLFFDKNQHLRKVASPPPLPVNITLNTNLRNSAEIARYSSVLLPEEEITPLDLSCKKVTVHRPIATAEGRNRKIRELIEELTTGKNAQYVGKKDIVVLSPFRGMPDTCFTDPDMKDILNLPSSDQYRIKSCLFSPSAKKVLTESILCFKGLEAPIIILTDLSLPVDVEGDKQKGDDNGTFTCNSFYVACTRAKYQLHIFPVNQQAADFADKVLKLSEA